MIEGTLTFVTGEEAVDYMFLQYIFIQCFKERSYSPDCTT